MTIEEKMERLQYAVMEEARVKANSIVEEHDRKLRENLKQHRIEVDRQHKTRIKAEQISARQRQSVAESQAQLELKREYGKRQKELKTELFEEVEQALQEYMKTEDYKGQLIAYIEHAAAFAGSEPLTIYINASDVDKKAYLEEHTGMQMTISKEDFVGGIRAVIRSKNVLIDHAYKGAIEREFKAFLFQGGVGVV